MQETYNNTTIYYSESGKYFYCTYQDQYLTNEDLKELKITIDRIAKEKFKPIECFVGGYSAKYGYDYMPCKITSINKQSRKIYFTKVDSKGTKIKDWADISYLNTYTFIEKNHDNIEKLIEIEAIKRAIDKKIKQINDIQTSIKSLKFNL